MGRSYKYRVTAVTETGEGAFTSGTFIAATVPMAPDKPIGTSFTESAVGIRWYFSQDFKATGGQPVTAWRVYHSADGNLWSDANSFVEALGVSDTAEGTATVPCPTARQRIWVRVAATNAHGDGAMSESVQLRCSAIPTELPAPVRVNGTDSSITIEYAAFDETLFNGANLLGFKISYAQAEDLSASSWQPSKSIMAGVHNQRYTLTGLIPGWPYSITVQAITEAGLNENVLLAKTIYSGGTLSGKAAPMFVQSNSETITIAWPPVSLTESANILKYHVYISADNRSYDWFNQTSHEVDATVSWPSITTPQQLEPVPLATVTHDCSSTTKKFANGTTKNEDRRNNFIYVRVATQTQAGLGELSDLAVLFCAPRPAAPEVLVVDHDEQQVTLQWTTDNLNSAPLVGYHIFADDGLGGDIKLIQTLENISATLYDAPDEYRESTRRWYETGFGDNDTFFNTSMEETTLHLVDTPFQSLLFSYPITGLKPQRHYRFQVSVISAAAESERSSIAHAGTCIAHATAPSIEPLPSGTSVNLTWHPPNTGTDEVKVSHTVFEDQRHIQNDSMTFGPSSAGLPTTLLDIANLDCQVQGYLVFYDWVADPVEMVEEIVIEYRQVGNSTVPHVKSRMVPKAVDLNVTVDDSFDNGTLISPSELSYVFTNLKPEARYRFKVRTVTAAGFKDSQWVISPIIGVPAVMPAPTHNIPDSSTTSIALSWELPDMNGGLPVGFQVFRNDGPGTAMSEAPDTTCLSVTDPSCIPPNCVWDALERVSMARGCTVPGLKKDTYYRFRIRALNMYGIGPLSPIAEIPTGTVPFARAPSLNHTSYNNCSLTFQWPAAVERGTVVYTYSLKLSPAANCTVESAVECSAVDVDVVGEPSWLMDGNASAPFVAMRATIDSRDWAGLVPGGRYKGAVRARSTITQSDWSEWSNLEVAPKGYCLSVPDAPTGLKRDPDEPARSGQIRLLWDAVTKPSEAGWDDPLAGLVVYDIWGKPGINEEYRRLATQPTHVDQQVMPATFNFDTFPETPLGASWQFKVRVGNRNGIFGPFGSEVALTSGRLPTAPLNMAASFSSRGRAYLYWQAPEYNGDSPIFKFQARCTDIAPWEDVENTKLTHVLYGTLPVGVVSCYVRAVNAVGAGPVATASVTVLQQVVQTS